MRRLTIMFIDLVESTQLSTRLEPELYRVLVGRYRELVTRTIERYEGHVASTKGMGSSWCSGTPLPTKTMSTVPCGRGWTSRVKCAG